MMVANSQGPHPVQAQKTLIAKGFKSSWKTCELEMAASKVLWGQGKYQRSVELRLRSLQRACELSGLDLDANIPSILGPYFSSNIGHLGIAAAIAHANEVGAVPRLNRSQLLLRIGNQEVVQALSGSFTQLKTPAPPTPMVTTAWALSDYDKEPAFWPWMERVDTIHTVTGTSDLYPFLESLGRRYPPERDKALRPSDEALSKSESLLARLGVSPGDPMVALHVREPRARLRDHRSAEIDTFLPAIHELTNAGVKVVRFGSANMTPLPKIPGLIDLVSSLPNDSQLDFAVMNRAIFMVSTMSGPVALASAMGLPTLVTNATSIARNTLTSGPATRYLPKKFLDEKGRLLTLSRNLQSPLGYWEGGLSPEIPRVPKTLDSSSVDILLGVREMLSVISSSEPNFETLHDRAESIRCESGAVSFGKFCGSFLSQNKNWLE